MGLLTAFKQIYAMLHHVFVQPPADSQHGFGISRKHLDHRILALRHGNTAKLLFSQISCQGNAELAVPRIPYVMAHPDHHRIAHPA